LISNLCVQTATKERSSCGLTSCWIGLGGVYWIWSI
jgi:hypothetical protein